jgi:hypothetical protein
VIQKRTNEWGQANGFSFPCLWVDTERLRDGCFSQALLAEEWWQMNKSHSVAFILLPIHHESWCYCAFSGLKLAFIQSSLAFLLLIYRFNQLI